MNLRNRLLFLVTLTSSLAHLSVTLNTNSVYAATPNCPAPALQRFQRYRAARGETVDSIAQQYNLQVATILRMNPGLRKGTVAEGSEILIPPFNGVVVEVGRGQTLRQIAARYKIRPDVLFEINGCQKNPKVVFVPTGNSRSAILAAPNTPTPSDNAPVNLGGYPLPQAAQVALPFGWQTNPQNGEAFFHSGIDLLADVGTPVKAVSGGRVVFAGLQGSYGNLVIINHPGGLQSRYAHLESIKVRVGDQVQQGEEVGNVGNTGTPATPQSHLHFEVRASSSLGWVAKDPKEYLGNGE